MANTIIGSPRKIPLPTQESSSFTQNAFAKISPLLVLLTLINLAALLDTCSGAAADSLLQGPDFKINARVSVAPTDLSPRHEYRAREYYSNSQKRARLQLKSSSRTLPVGLQYFYAGTNKLLRLTGFSSIKEKPADCSNVNQDQLLADLFGSSWKNDEGLKGDDWLGPQKDVPEYLIGISRLLFLIEANKQKLVLQPSKELISIRGRTTAGYGLDCLYIGSQQQCTKISAFYLAQQPDQPVNQLDEKLPLLVQATLPKGTIVTIHFFLVNPVDLLPVEQISPRLSNVINKFTFPVGSGCSASLLAADLLGEWPAPKVMSFEVKLTDFVANTIRNMFVAYDGYADASRIDLVQESMRPGQSAPYSINIDDMRRNRRYNIIQTVGGSPLQCVASRQFGRTTRRDPYASLIPFNQLVEMGEAKVRGVRSVVFEAATNNLPALLFPRVNYVDSKGLDQSSELPVINLEKMTGDNKRYSVIYFFAAEATGPAEGNLPGPRLGGYGRLGPLLRVDVLQVDANQASSSNQPKAPAIKGLYRAEIHNFMWQLSDALNGDRADELFSVHDKCSSLDNTADSYGLLAIDMAYDAVNQKSAYSSGRAMEMIGTPLVRNKGLIRALSDGLLISASQIYDIESRIYQSTNEKFLLRATARVSYIRNDLFTATSFGLGYVRSLPPVLLIDTFNDCYWEAARRRQQRGPVLFTFCFSLCHIEDQPLIDESTGRIVDSEVFKLDSKHESEPDLCEILQLDMEADDAAQISRPLWASIYKSLNERVLRIPLIEQRRVNDLAFKVQRVEINNDKWSATNNEGRIVSARSEPDAELLTGLGLSDKWASRADPPADSSQMDYALCHSICVNKMSCRSFSLCASGQDQLECLISELEFRNSTLLDRLDELKRAKTKEMRGVATRGVIQLSAVDYFDAGDDQSGGAESEQQYELKVDKRCRIYNKHALEMFKVPSIEQTTVWRDKTSLIGVNNEEECAQICLNRNVKFFKRSARSRLQVERERDSYTGAEIEYVAKMMVHQSTNIQSWCSSFSYINLLTSTIPDELKTSEIKGDYQSKGGLCILTKFKLTPKKGDAKPVSPVPTAIRLKVHKYEIIYSLFYERQHGSKLRPLWNYRMSPKGDLDDVGHDKVPEMIREGNNQVAIDTNSVESCARACFLQTIGLDPWCKSFGFTSLTSTQTATANSEITTTTRSYCIFNSISMADARKSPVADRLIFQVPETDSFVHYEPRNSYTLEDVVQTKLMLDKAIDNIIGSNKEGAFRFHFLGTALLFLVSLATGLMLSVYLAPRINLMSTSRRGSSASPSRTFLNGLIGGDSDITHRRFEPVMDLPDLLADRTAGFTQ